MKKPQIFFNASVILAGFNSSVGASALLLKWVKEKRIRGVIGEIVLAEVLRHAQKIGWEKKKIEQTILAIFQQVLPAPKTEEAAIWKRIVTDDGDAHLFASAMKTECDFLVSLDKKHVLVLKNKIKNLKIVSPAELIEELRNKI